MLRLLSLLQTHRYWSGSELADRLEVSPRTLRRDVERLRDLGYQVDAIRGVAGGYQLQAGGSMAPLLLEDEEAVAIAVGLRTTAGVSGAGIQDWSLQALTKVMGLMPPRLRRQMDAVTSQTDSPAPWSGGPVVDAVTLSTLAQACRDTEHLRFTYTAREAEPTQRSVEPHRLVSIGRRWYLVAYDRDRLDWRSFRVDRITDPQPSGARVRPRELPAADAVAFVQAGIRRMSHTHDVRVHIAAEVDRVTAVAGHWASVTATDGGCVMEMSVDQLGWPLMILGEVGAEFQVESPPALIEAVAEVADRFGRSGSAQSRDVDISSEHGFPHAYR